MAFVDISQELHDEMPVYPGKERPHIESRESFSTDEDGRVSGGRVMVLTIKNHTGTHIDAPSHMRADGSFLDEHPVESFVFDALKVDCTSKAANELITVDDCPEPTDHDLLLFQTNWSRHWGTAKYHRHPCLGTDAAQFCVDHDYHVGLEAFSPDPIPKVDLPDEEAEGPKEFPAHDVLFDGDRFVIENLASLTPLPRECRLFAFPLPLRNADGSPIRAIAKF